MPLVTPPFERPRKSPIIGIEPKALNNAALAKIFARSLKIEAVKSAKFALPVVTKSAKASPKLSTA